MAGGATVFRIRVELIFKRCWNLVTPLRRSARLPVPGYLMIGDLTGSIMKKFPRKAVRAASAATSVLPVKPRATFAAPTAASTQSSVVLLMYTIRFIIMDAPAAVGRQR
jgi:hypothetical protein